MKSLLGGGNDSPKAETKSNSKKLKVKVKKSDTNVLSLSLGNISISHGKLRENSSIYLCSGCSAAFSKVSSYNDKGWSCEFCGVENTKFVPPKKVKNNPEITHTEIFKAIKGNDTQYVIKAAPPKIVHSEDNNSLVIFCVVSTPRKHPYQTNTQSFRM